MPAMDGESVHTGLTGHYLGMMNVKLGALRNASGDYLFRKIRGKHAENLAVKYAKEPCTVTFVGTVESNRRGEELRLALNDGTTTAMVLGGNHTLSPSADLPEQVNLYKQLTVVQARGISAQDNHSVNDSLELTGFTLGEICRTIAKKDTKNQFQDLDKPLVPVLQISVDLKAAYPKLTEEEYEMYLNLCFHEYCLQQDNLDNVWKWYKWLGMYPEKYHAQAEAFSIALDEDRISNLPDKELLYGDGKMRVKFGYNAVRELMENRGGIKKMDWAGVFHDLKECLGAGDYLCIKRSHAARQSSTAPKSRRDESAKERGQSSPLFAASATEYLGVSPAGSMNAVSVVSPSETIADSLEVSNPAHVEDENAQSEPESTTAGAQYDKNSRRSFSSNESTKTPTAKPAKSRRFTRKIKRTKSAADVFDSESEEETQPSAPAALKKKRAAFTQAAETQHRGVGSKEDIRALGKECADLDYVADAWLSSLGEEANFWRAKYCDLMGACLQRPETSCAVAAAQKVSVEQCEIGRLSRKIVRLEQGVGCQNGKYQSDADAVFGLLAEIPQNRAEHVRKSEIVAWFLDKYESDCPIELVEARAFRVNLLLNRMVTEGMILYISVMPGSSQPAERGELQYDPEVMMDPHWATVGLQEHN